jgi:wyosine [tRNA(Phe)-imidazoG37] synthetase (radical SAM superfamily)
MTIPLQHGLIYGPVTSRRFGRSLGVNVLPEGQKACNLNCAYCQYGWTDSRWSTHQTPIWPSPAAVAHAVCLALGKDDGIDRITLAGNGEPTLHPRFAEIVARIAEVRDRMAPQVRLGVLSNSSTLRDPDVRVGLALLDERCMKLDAGDATTLRRVNGVGLDVPELVAGLRAVGPVMLQALFTRDAERRVDNTSERAIAAWLDAVRAIAPAGVYIYSIDRGPAFRKLERVPRAELEAIARRVRDAGFDAQAF